jgi:signal transduction histidine kinase
MLQGLDYEWIDAGERRYANYTHLDPGEYVFKVKATNHSGVWSSNIASIHIIISPPFWSTWLFRILFTLFLILFGVYFYRKRILNLESEKKAQEIFSERLLNSQEAERERIASELHDSFGQNLLIIKNRALLGLKSNDIKNTKQQFNEISSSASSALDEVRQISYNLHPYQLKRLGLTKAIKSIITNVDGIHNVRFEIEDVNIDSLFSKDNEINVYRVVQECINNIIKHSEASEASIHISRSNEIIAINISDNGKGFNTHETKNRSGFGIQNIERRLQLLKGKVEIKSELAKGTKVKIIIPVNKNER